MPTRPPVLAALLAAVLLLGCTRSTTFERGGATRPAGGPGAGYPTLEAAKAAFSRTHGPMTALLSDVAWIRMEPDPSEAEARHPRYFEGWTVFDVTLHTDHFVRPTEESYLLEDASGARLSARPQNYQSDIGRGFGPRFIATFRLEFPHAVPHGTKWVRLTREGPGGGTVAWEL